MRTLSWMTVIFTYMLMVWGNTVSATGSGLACPDWPLCHGTIFPPLRFDVILEWGHRTLAALTSCLILATMVGLSFRSQSEPYKKSFRKIFLFAGGLLVTQILLGGITVMLELSKVVSSIHLVIATLVLACVITAASLNQWRDRLTMDCTPQVKSYATVMGLGLLTQFFIGAWVRHSHSGLACPNFPDCFMGAFFPDPPLPGAILAFAHRWLGVSLVAGFVLLTFATLRGSNPRSFVLVSLGLLSASIGQVILGIMTVWTGLDTLVRATHAALGYSLWIGVYYIWLRSGGIHLLQDSTPRSSERLQFQN